MGRREPAVVVNERRRAEWPAVAVICFAAGSYAGRDL
jgi:hypothetical protein